MSTPSTTRPRAALVGVSGYGRIHLNLARECERRGELEIVAATIINRDEEHVLVAELQSGGCEIFGEFDAMMAAWAGRLDLCLVPTGIHWHAPMTIKALRQGANVLVEKPLCVTVAEADAIRQTEQESGKFVAVGFQDFYDPGTLWLKSELVRGAIGTVESVRFLGVWPRSRSYFTRNNWAGRIEVDGRAVYDSPLSNAFAHFVMLSLFFAGRNERAAANATLLDAELFRAHDIESFDTGVARLTTPDGVQLWFGASHASRETIEPQIEITGSGGTACWRYERDAVWVDRSGREERRELSDVGGARRAMIATTLQRWRDSGVAVCTPEIASKHTEFIEALHLQGTVEPFAADMVDWGAAPSAPDAIPAVDGLEEALRAAYAAGMSLKEACGAWPLRRAEA